MATLRPRPREVARSGFDVPSPTRPVFTVGRCEWTRGDVVELMRSDPRFDAVFAAPSHHRAALAAAAARGTAPTPVSTSLLVEALRRDRQLLTRDETRRWLDSWDLSYQDLVGYAQGALAARHLSVDRLHMLAADHAAAEQVTAADTTDPDPAALWAHVVCSGAFTLTAGRLAAGAAAFDAVTGTPERPSFSALEIARRQLRRASTSEDALRESVDTHWIEWTWVDGACLTFETRDGAAEGRLGVITGRPLDDLSPHAVDVRHDGFFVEAAPPEWWWPLVGSLPGEIVGPWPAPHGHEICLVHRTTEPHLGHHATRQLATEHVGRRAEDANTIGRVRWHVDT